jgi:hypothetical protein
MGAAKRSKSQRILSLFGSAARFRGTALVELSKHPEFLVRLGTDSHFNFWSASKRGPARRKLSRRTLEWHDLYIG